MPLIGLDKVKKAVDNIVLAENERVKSIYIQGLSAIITQTPVSFKDGGRLRNNWFLTVGAPSGSYGRGPEGKAATGSHASVSKMPNYVLDKDIYFTNNSPYANIVEYGLYPKNPKLGSFTGSSYQKLSTNGYSDQLPKEPPRGMARVSIIKMSKKL